jgi:membrane protein YdbS with pleckstrin-like domain
MLNPGETITFSTRTHPKALAFPILVLIVLLAIGVAGQVYIDQHVVDLVIWALVAVAAIVWVLVPVLRWLTATYTVTNRRLITREGILTRTGHDIPMTRISDVEYERDIIDRMLGCGTLIISDASTNGSVKLYDIPHVERSQNQINEILNQLHSGNSGDGA